MPEGIEPALVGVVGTLLGVVVGASTNLVADHLRSRRERRARERTLLLERLEELTQVTDQIAQAYRDQRALTGRLASGERTTLKEYRAELPTPAPWGRLRALVLFHAPVLEPAFERLIGLRHDIGRASVRLLYADDFDHVDKKEAKKGLDGAIIELLKQAERLQRDAANEYRKWCLDNVGGKN